jgi:DNA invertase Pin-like site-specific DNA recombinase
MKVHQAAIWARVSTAGQAELSLDSQVERCRQKLEAEGYGAKPEHILKVTWSSAELANCPDYMRLWDWVSRKEIAAVTTLDSDRLSCKSVERLVFRAHCKENDCRLLLCQGIDTATFTDEAEGELLEVG